MRKFTIKLLTKLPTKYVTSGLILIMILFLYAIIGSMLILHLNLIDSIYYSVITMSTVGYGDYIPKTGIQKIFATTLALGGVALLAYVFNIMLTTFQERMNKYSKGARKMRFIKEMEDYYILCGFGRVGHVVYNELKQRNQNVIIIEKEKELCENVKEDSSTVVINKDATQNELISELTNEKCKSVIISTGSDVNNIFIVLAVRETNPDAWIVARVSKPENISRLKIAGANKIVSPEITGGKSLYLESVKPHLLRLTVRHKSDKLYDEFKIIKEHGCTLENIDYHIPGIETPLSHKIKAMDLDEGEKYKKYLEEHEDAEKALNNLYISVNNVHSHLISGPDNATLNKLIKELEENEEIIGKNLTNKEIAEITKKELIKPIN